MRILFITTSHNGLSQRLWSELSREGHSLHLQLATSDKAMIGSVYSFSPDLIIAPFLKKAIPEEIWKRITCLIVHPGIKGDRGPSSLDWAIMQERKEWGVTILQADAEMDTGDIWDTQNFPMRAVSKSALYRHEVTQAATEAVLRAVENFQNLNFKPEPLNYNNPSVKGQWNNPIKRKDREINWQAPSSVILKRIRAADSSPGVLENTIFDEPYFLYGAHQEDLLKGKPGKIIGQRDGAICIGTGDGSIWVSHLKKKSGGIKLKATVALGANSHSIPEFPLSPFDPGSPESTYREIWFKRQGDVGYLHFNFYNGAMSTDQCFRLRKALMKACSQDFKVLVLKGGSDLWSNGIHLNVIENAENPADESWANIMAMNDLVREIMLCDTKLIISAMAGNTGAGGVILALAADYVYARKGVMLNPHYKKIGLFGSEYWTYLLPRRVGRKQASRLTEECPALDSTDAKKIGLIDDHFGNNLRSFEEEIGLNAGALANHESYETLLFNKRLNRILDETTRSIESYRNDELREMWHNFYEEDSSYHRKRYLFVHKVSDGGSSSLPAEINNFKLVPKKKAVNAAS